MRFPAFENLKPDQVALWFLGQAGYVVEAPDVSVAIDPYLTDSVSKFAPEFGRLFLPPLAPEELNVDVYITTHDHGDHLDPETVEPYAHKDTTVFVAPRLAARTLGALGVPNGQICVLDTGESEQVVAGLRITGVYAVPTSTDVLDTCGYLLEFDNGRTVYHTSDTAHSPLLLDAAPQAEVLLTCINGKFGNLTIGQAVELACQVRPRFVVPNHYDLMAFNSENPRAFAYFLRQAWPDAEVQILETMRPFVWGEE